MSKIILLFALIIGGTITYQVSYYASSKTISITINKTDRITTGSGEDISSKYLIFTDETTYENTDLMFLGKWNSSDIQGKFKAGETYKVKVVGWRIPILSMYPNIVEIK